MGLWQRFGGLVAKAFGQGAEGTWRGPFYGQGELGGVFMLEPNSEGWQRNINIPRVNAEHVPIVYACVMAQARAVAACYAEHKTKADNGGETIQTGTWPARLLRTPNDYETWPQFILNVVAELLFKGESLAIIKRDNRFVPVGLHRVYRGSWQPYVDPDSGAIFYGVSKSGNPCIPGELDYVVPARDVVHFRQHCPRHPLVGESPVTAAALAVGINVALSASQAQFFSQMRRPSGVLSTDVILNKEQIKELRAAFDEQATRLAQGGIPILAGGLKFSPMSISSQDSQLIQAQRMSVEDVCRVYGVPPPVVCDLTHATLQNAEALINHWLALGLGSLLVDFLTRMDGLNKATQGGVYAANEARAKEGLAPVPGGQYPLVQQQMVSLEYAASQKAPPVPAPTVNPDDPQDPPPSPPAPEPAKAFDGTVARALVFEQIARKRAVTHE
jgi:HK97 family phage portal protein